MTIILQLFALIPFVIIYGAVTRMHIMCSNALIFDKFEYNNFFDRYWFWNSSEQIVLLTNFRPIHCGSSSGYNNKLEDEEAEVHAQNGI